MNLLRQLSWLVFPHNTKQNLKRRKTEEIVFKVGATGHFELLVNGNSLVRFDNWRTLPTRIPYKVEKDKKYKIEIRYAQLNNWQANLEFDFGKELDIDFSGLINNLKGIDVVVFVGRSFYIVGR